MPCVACAAQSLACYRTAVRLDPRHYNAMYGVGQIYLRQVWGAV